MRPTINEELKRTKKINCRANEEEYIFISTMKDKYNTTIRDLILLGIKTLEETDNQ